MALSVFVTFVPFRFWCLRSLSVFALRQLIYSYKKIIIWLRSADEAGRLLGALLDGDRDVLRHLWMSFADPMVCPVEPRPWHAIPLSFEGQVGDGIGGSNAIGDSDSILALMLDARRW